MRYILYFDIESDFSDTSRNTFSSAFFVEYSLYNLKVLKIILTNKRFYFVLSFFFVYVLSPIVLHFIHPRDAGMVNPIVALSSVISRFGT